MTAAPLPDLKAGDDVMAFHRETLVFDCTTLLYAVDEPYASRMKEGGVDVVNLTTVAETEGWDDTLKITETALKKIEKSPILVQATTAAEVRAAKKAGKIAVILGTQGASMLDTQLWRLGVLHRLGYRYFGLAYTGANVFADGCGERRDAGVSFLGKELIELCNDLGMILDLAHCGHQTRWEAAQLARHPVCTHSNAYAVNANDRNTKDETIKAIAAKGGVIGICGLVRSVWPKDATIEHMLDHLDRMVRLVGHQHVGLGLDFVEGYQEDYRAGKVAVSEHDKPPKWRTLRPDIFGTVEDFYNVPYPKGLDQVRLLPNFTQGLMDRQYPRDQVAAIMGGNWFRHFERAVG